MGPSLKRQKTIRSRMELLVLDREGKGLVGNGAMVKGRNGWVDGSRTRPDRQEKNGGVMDKG
jgi:hypothetical protein